MTIIIFLLVLGVLVFVHELGHFLAAKISKMRVDEFALGFPPRLFSIKKGETKYSINLLPLGGYVKIFGESPDPAKSEEKDPRSFVSKNRGLQTFVLLAGILFNILFAWGLFSYGFITGIPTSSSAAPSERLENPRLLILSTYPDSPAQKVGLRSGDEILFVGTDSDKVEMINQDTVSQFINSHPGKDISVLIKRGNETTTFTLTPEEHIIEGKYAIGVSMDYVGILKLPPFQAIAQGGLFTIDTTVGVAKGMTKFITDAVTGKGSLAEVTGPVGIANLVGDVTKLGFSYLITFTAFISINLAILNLVPFPALDGGRLLFVIIEAVTRKKIPVAFANTLNTIGFFLLILLMVVITYKDIVRLF